MLPAQVARMRITPEQARQERALRKQAKANFLNYCTYMDPLFQTPPHIQLIAYKLQQVLLFLATHGEKGINRLMILMPPQHGKSQTVSRHFPAMALGVLPDTHIILTSYAADLAVKHSREVRNALESQRYRALFGTFSTKEIPVELSSDSRSVQSWDLAQPYRGGLLATGVGGGVTGNPSDLFIIDDPFKNREEAESEGRRELVDDWYKSSARTRLSPFAAMIIFHTRWHPEDLAGKLIQRMVNDPLADRWDIVCLPALALGDHPASEEAQRKMMRDGVFLPLADPLGRKTGQALWQERYGEAWLESQKANVGDYDFEALYQQMPYPKKGRRYEREWFKVIPKVPDDVKLIFLVRYWDKAGTETGDFTSGTLMGYGTDGYFYMLDVERGKWTPYERDKKMHDTAEADRKQWGNVQIWHQQDPGSAGLDSAISTNRKLMGFPAFFEPASGSKEIRSDSLESAFQGRMVFLLQGAWNEPVIDVYVAFPKGRYDDDVDSGSGAYNKLIEMISEEPVQEGIVVYEERVEISPY